MSQVKELPVLACRRCGHRWVPRRTLTPRRCSNPKCRTPYWNVPRKGGR